MGNGATKAKSVLQQELDKPVDASDIQNYDAAVAEIRRLRTLIRSELDGGDSKVLQSSSIKKRQSQAVVPAASAATKKKDRRGEVSAEAFGVGGDMNSPPVYEKKVVPKDNAARAIIAAAVDDSVLFQNIRAAEKADAVDAFFSVEAAAGDVVINQGDQGDNFYVVETGTLVIKVSHNGGPGVRHGEVTTGGGFGELALMYNTPRAATIEASSAVKMWALDRNSYRGIVQNYMYQRKQRHLDFLKQVDALKSLSEREFTRLASVLEEEEFEPNQVIIRQGEKGDHFYIIAEGEVDVTKSEGGAETPISVLGEGSYFGERALKTEDTRQATVTAKTKVTLLSVGRDVFIEVLGNLSELESRSIPEESAVGGLEATDNKYSVEMQLGDLEVKQTLGCGAFGRVKLVLHPASNKTYALKCLAKQDIVNNNLQGHVLNERNVMVQLDHPFILKLHNSFKDNKYIYFLLELALGGEMFTFLRKAGRFNEAASRFYAASTVLAFQHMHAKRICYRDLKPENLCLDDRGFLKVVDFGLAKYVADRTWTLCGTPDYLAPEIILSKGHDMAVDYWALGVLIYEMTAGFVPFYSDDPMEVYQLILSDDVRYPSHFSRACSDLVSKLLTSNQSKRLGNTKAGINGIIKHKWFSGFDWEGLLAFNMTPPIVPIVNGKDDVSNFDEYPEEDEDVPDCSWDPEF